MAIDAAVAVNGGVPVIFVSSDDKGTAEAEQFFPGVGHGHDQAGEWDGIAR